MFQLKMKITLLKQKNCEGENHFDGNDNKNAKLFKSQISLLQQENSFIKSRLNKKQNIMEKMLDYKGL